MANNLKDHLKEVADAIRAKKGTSNLINPQDFATEIEGISGGGESGDSTGGWELKYYKINKPVSEDLGAIFLYGSSCIVNCTGLSVNEPLFNGGAAILATAINSNTFDDILSIVTAKVPIEKDGTMKEYSLEDIFTELGAWEMVLGMITPITEEEYYNPATYDLNA